MNLQDLLNQLAQRLEMPPIPLSDDGFFHLRLDDDLRLRLAHSEDTGELVLLSTLMSLPAGEAGVAVMRMLLAANFRWCFSARGHFGVQPDTGEVEFALREHLADLDAPRLEALLQNVGSVLSTVLDEVRRGGVAGTGDSGDSLPAPALGVLTA
jgi:hypothetical protein